MFTCPPSSAVRPPPRKLVSSNRHPPSLDDDFDGDGVNLEEPELVGFFLSASEKAAMSKGPLNLQGGPTGFTLAESEILWVLTLHRYRDPRPLTVTPSGHWKSVTVTRLSL